MLQSSYHHTATTHHFLRISYPTIWQHLCLQHSAQFARRPRAAQNEANRRAYPTECSKSTIRQPQRAVILQKKSYFCRKQYSHASSGVTQHPRAHFLFPKQTNKKWQKVRLPQRLISIWETSRVRPRFVGFGKFQPRRYRV